MKQEADSNTPVYNRRTWLLGTAASLATCSPWKHSLGKEISATGRVVPGLESFDSMMQSFLNKHDVTGASLAVVKNQRLVYARGFSFANKERKTAVQPSSLFRIASLSKPITAVAIMQFVEQGKISLDTPVVKVLKIQNTKDKRWQKITIRNLLQHTGGWDSSVSFDPMFRPLTIAKQFRQTKPAPPDLIIRYMQERTLNFDPGTRYAYSNFGYCLLGRVLEQLSGTSYEKTVQNKLLKPLNIKQMRIGKTQQTSLNEVTYYDRKNRKAKSVVGAIGKVVPVPYGAWFLEAMDSHGGWIASATDLVRFAASLDNPQHSPILKPNSIASLFNVPEGKVGHEANGKVKNVYYGCGWSVRRIDKQGQHINTWHTGALDGTSTLLVRRYDGLDWAVLFNNRANAAGKNLASLIDPLVHQAANKVKKWGRGIALFE